jgi:hypothetical protein
VLQARDVTNLPAPETLLTFKCKKLLFCTGKHATPIMPHIHTDGSVSILHSSQVQSFEAMKDKRVVIVGAGASSLDLCINSLKANETSATGQTFWVLRKPKYFAGFEYGDLLLITITQLILGLWATPLINLVLTMLIYFRFACFGLTHWLPRRMFDLRYEQFIPNRSYLLKNSHRIDRRVGTEVKEIHNRDVTLSDGSVIKDVDYVLMGTGYKPPKRPPGEDFGDHLYMKVAASGEHFGRLFVLGEELLDSTGATPIAVHVLSRHFWYQMKADQFEDYKFYPRMQVPKGYNLNNLDTLFLAAPCIRAVYPYGVWRVRMLMTHLYYRMFYNTRVFFPDRVLGLGISMDEES